MVVDNQKQLSTGVLKNTFSKNFIRKISEKPVVENFFSKVTGLG